MTAPTQIKYRGKLYRLAASTPAPYPRSPKEVMVGVNQMHAGLSPLATALAAMKVHTEQLSRLLWQIEQIATDPYRKIYKDWPQRGEGESKDPRAHFVAMGEVIDQFNEASDKLKAVLKKNFAKVEYLAGK
jgi:hypothetical protein